MKYLIPFGLFIISFYDSLPQDIKLLNDSAQYYIDHSNFDKAFALASQAKSFTENRDLEEERYRSVSILGAVAFRRGELREAQKLYEECLEIATHAGKIDWRAKSLSNLASILNNLDEYDSAETILLKIIALHEVDKKILISSYGRLGVNKKRQQQYDDAVKYYNAALVISQELNDSLSSARTLANIGNVYMEQDETQRAIEYFKQSLSLLDSTKHGLSISGISVFLSDAYQTIGNYRQAESVLRSALNIIEKLNLPASKAYALESLGILYTNLGQIDRAIQTLQEALVIQRSLDSSMGIESVLFQLGKCYLITGDFKEAERSLSESYALAKQHNHALMLQYVYKQLSALDSAKGDFSSALSHYKKFVHIKDSLFTLEKAKAVEDINRKFETQQKIKIIDEQQHIITKERTEKTFVIIMSSVIVIAAMIVLLVVRRNSRIKTQMERELQQKQQLLTVVMTQEQVQQKIARDLHDSLVQILGAAKIKLESIQTPQADSKAKSELNEAITIIESAAADARNIAHQLLPYSLERHGLIMALQELLQKQPRKENELYSFSFKTEVERFSKNIEITVYRIVQELINNAIKHAKPNHVRVHLNQVNGYLRLSVNDDGKGFDTKSISRGAGLNNIDSRLQSVRGSMRIESAVGAGTTTIIEIPLT